MDLGVQASSLEILTYSGEETKGNSFHRRKRSMNFRDGLAKREGEERKDYQNIGKMAFLLSLP